MGECLLTLTAAVMKLQICKEITDNKNIEELKKKLIMGFVPESRSSELRKLTDK